MKQIITDIVGKFNSQLIKLFNRPNLTLADLEKDCIKCLQENYLDIIKGYIEQQDEMLKADKPARKQQHLVIERNHDPRQILTRLGVLTFERTYYKQAVGQTNYVYPIDVQLGIDQHQRITESVGAGLVSHAIRESYQKAAVNAANGQVSKQTVMSYLRKAMPASKPQGGLQTVPVLHIDADEDHVALQTGKSAIVPLISVYEGIERQGNRNVCKNMFQVSEYGGSPTKLWERVAEEIEKRYDISDTQIYVHGDGANWIKQAKDIIPGSYMCLDKYHFNKYCKQITAGMKGLDCALYQAKIKNAFNWSEKELATVIDEMIQAYPMQAKNILECYKYFANNFDSIQIYAFSEEANKGGATEPHVSHTLSSRLSSRPMGWSEKTLKSLVPLLAAKSFTLDPKKQETASASPEAAPKAGREANVRTHYRKGTLGLADPDQAVHFAYEGYESPFSYLLKHIGETDPYRS